jgi:hypothetical protein
MVDGGRFRYQMDDGTIVSVSPEGKISLFDSAGNPTTTTTIHPIPGLTDLVNRSAEKSAMAKKAAESAKAYEEKRISKYSQWVRDLDDFSINKDIKTGRWDEPKYIGDRELANLSAYHGTSAKPFESFKTGETGLNTSSDSSDVISLTDEPSHAKGYATEKNTPDSRVLTVIGHGDGKIKMVDYDGKSHDASEMLREQNIARDQGYAGVQFIGLEDSGGAYMPFAGATNTIQIFKPEKLKIKSSEPVGRGGAQK